MVHSHRRGIIDIAYHAMLSRLVSVSEDQTIRVWVVQGTNIQQEYEFRCLDSMATVVHSQHTRNCALVGFDNGVLRIFDLKALVLKRELTLEIGAISAIASTSVDNLLLVSGVKETLCLNGQMDIIKTHPHKHYVSEKCQPVV
jgi:WD40 repeat protein